MRNIEGKRFAFISDLHGKDPTPHIKKIKKQAIDLVVLGGDIPDSTQKSLTSICKKFLTLNIPVVIFPGSHENGEVYKKALSKIKDENLIDATKVNNRRIFFGDMDLIIIPGSDVVGRGSKNYNGGSFWLREKKTPKIVKESNKKIKEIKFARKATLVFIEDTIKLMSKKRTKPASRILLTHIPPKCKSKKGIDIAHLKKKKFLLLFFKVRILRSVRCSFSHNSSLC